MDDSRVGNRRSSNRSLRAAASSSTCWGFVMKVMYQTGNYKSLIVKRDVLRTTEHFVFYAGPWGCENREAKTSTHASWFETFQDAKSHLTDEKQRRIDFLWMQLEQAQKELIEIQELSESP